MGQLGSLPLPKFSKPNRWDILVGSDDGEIAANFWQFHLFEMMSDWIFLVQKEFTECNKGTLSLLSFGGKNYYSVNYVFICQITLKLSKKKTCWELKKISKELENLTGPGHEPETSASSQITSLLYSEALAEVRLNFLDTFEFFLKFQLVLLCFVFNNYPVV